MVAGLIEHRQIGIIVPIAGQIESEAGKWRGLARPPIFTTASPYNSPPEAVGDAGATLKSRGAEAILLDCIGFTERHRAALAGSPCRSSCRTPSSPRRSANYSKDDAHARRHRRLRPGQQFRIEGKPGGPLAGSPSPPRICSMSRAIRPRRNPDWARSTRSRPAMPGRCRPCSTPAPS